MIAVFSCMRVFVVGVNVSVSFACFVLFCVVLCCAVLCCAVLCCAVLYVCYICTLGSLINGSPPPRCPRPP